MLGVCSRARTNWPTSHKYQLKQSKGIQRSGSLHTIPRFYLPLFQINRNRNKAGFQSQHQNQNQNQKADAPKKHLNSFAQTSSIKASKRSGCRLSVVRHQRRIPSTLLHFQSSSLKRFHVDNNTGHSLTAQSRIPSDRSNLSNWNFVAPTELIPSPSTNGDTLQIHPSADTATGQFTTRRRGIFQQKCPGSRVVEGWT